MRRLLLCALVVTNYPCYSRDIKAPVPPTRSGLHLLHKWCLNTGKEDVRACERLASIFSILCRQPGLQSRSHRSGCGHSHRISQAENQEEAEWMCSPVHARTPCVCTVLIKMHLSWVSAGSIWGPSGEGRSREGGGGLRLSGAVWVLAEWQELLGNTATTTAPGQCPMPAEHPWGALPGGKSPLCPLPGLGAGKWVWSNLTADVTGIPCQIDFRWGHVYKKPDQVPSFPVLPLLPPVGVFPWCLCVYAPSSSLHSFPWHWKNNPNPSHCWHL